MKKIHTIIAFLFAVSLALAQTTTLNKNNSTGNINTSFNLGSQSIGGATATDFTDLHGATAYARTLWDNADAATSRASLGVPGVDAAFYGFSISASGADNSTALNAALAAHKTVWVSAEGTADLSGKITLNSGNQLYLNRGLVIRRSGTTEYELFTNAGASAANNEMDEDISIYGNGARIQVNGNEGSTAARHGLRAHVAFANVKRLKLMGLRCTDLERSSFFIHVSNFDGLEVGDFEISGTGAGNIKDGVHLGAGTNFRVHDGLIKTNDDPLALNAGFDYDGLSTYRGSLRHGVIERITIQVPSGGTADGYFRFLPGAWKAWTTATSYDYNDTITNGTTQYTKTDAGTEVSSVMPTHTPAGTVVTGADGISWRSMGPGSHTVGVVEDVVIQDITIEAPVYASIIPNGDAFGRSFFPGTTSDNLVRNITFKRVTLRHPTPATTPLVFLGLKCDNITVEDMTLDPSYLPGPLFLNAASVNGGRLVMRRIYVPAWHNGTTSSLVSSESGGSFDELLVEDCNITGRNDGTNFQSIDGIIAYSFSASSLGDIIVRGGTYDWVTSLVRNHSTGGFHLDIQGATFKKVRRLVALTGSSGSNTNIFRLRGNHFEQAPTIALWGVTTSNHSVIASLSNNVFDATSLTVGETTGTSRITFSDTPIDTSKLSTSAAVVGDRVRTTTGWAEFNGTAWVSQSFAGAFATTGAYNLTFATTGNTLATLPSGTPTLLATGGSGAALTGITATQIATTPAGNLAATTQAATNAELDAEKATKALTATATLDFGSIASLAQADLTITVSGATTGSAVVAGLPASPDAGIVWNAFVSATNTITIRATNITALPVDPASATFRATVLVP